MQTQLNDAQLKALQDLYSNDPEFRKVVQAKIKERAAQAQQEAKTLAQAQSLFSPTDAPKKKGARVHVKAGSRNHRPAIMAAVQGKPGMTVSELRDSLKASKHDIGDKTLNTLLNTMKKEFAKDGKKGLRTEGEKPSTRFFAS